MGVELTDLAMNIETDRSAQSLAQVEEAPEQEGTPNASSVRAHTPHAKVGQSDVVQPTIDIGHVKDSKEQETNEC
jgi:hypothetical protein